MNTNTDENDLPPLPLNEMIQEISRGHEIEASHKQLFWITKYLAVRLNGELGDKDSMLIVEILHDARQAMAIPSPLKDLRKHNLSCPLPSGTHQ